MEALESLQPGSYVGQWGSRVDNDAVFRIKTMGQGYVSGRVEVLENTPQIKAGTQFGFRLEKNDSGEWHFTWEEPPVDVFETLQTHVYPTPQGLMIGAFFRTDNQDLWSATFWLDPDLIRHPKWQPRQMLKVSGEIRMKATPYTAGNGLIYKGTHP